uniref:Uncharacterized protein n=1 Tax=Meloidogyne incognita TaxID=6306 RepID=A0A914M283_MELIC
MEEEKEEDEENNKLNNSSEYTHLNELFKGKQQIEQQQPSTSGENNNFRYSFKNGGDEVSVAGTDFNEPWDSNAWENLLEIAKFGDAKTEIPLLSEKPRRRRSSCDTSSISSDGSTWRRSSPSSDDDNNDLEYLNKKKENENENKKENFAEENENNSTDDDINVAEEAVAMAVVLAGNGTLPNRKKPRPMEWLCEEELLENEEEEGEEEENKVKN